MRRAQVHASAAQHHGLGAALCAALDKPVDADRMAGSAGGRGGADHGP